MFLVVEASAIGMAGARMEGRLHDLGRHRTGIFRLSVEGQVTVSAAKSVEMLRAAVFHPSCGRPLGR